MSGSLVLRFKKELRTLTDLMDLVDVLKRVAVSQFHTLDEERQRKGWATLEDKKPGRSRYALLEPDMQDTQTDSQEKQSGMSVTVVLEDFFQIMPWRECAHPFLLHASGPPAFVIMTTDEGFLGGLNASVIQEALRTPGSENAELIVIGERGKLYLTDLKRQHTSFPGVGAKIDLQAVGQLKDYLIGLFMQKKIGKVVVFYPKFDTINHQEVSSMRLLPYQQPLTGSRGVSPGGMETILESPGSAIVEYLINLWMARKLHEVYWHSRLSELAARTMHLEGSFQALQDIKKKQVLQYFRSKHEATDTSIRESYAGLLSKGKKKKTELTDDLIHGGDR